MSWYGLLRRCPSSLCRSIDTLSLTPKPISPWLGIFECHQCSHDVSQGLPVESAFFPCTTRNASFLSQSSIQRSYSNGKPGTIGRASSQEAYSYCDMGTRFGRQVHSGALKAFEYGADLCKWGRMVSDIGIYAEAWDLLS